MSKTKAAISTNIPLFAAMCLLLLMAALPNFEAYMAEYRWYRDARGLTPFSQVSVTQTTVVEDGLIPRGAMKKDRCRILPETIHGYVYFAGKPRRRTVVDTSPEDQITGLVGVNRPPSPHLEAWGPWFIQWRGETPDRWEIFASHTDCPTPPYDQTNLFASGPWADVALEE